MSSISYSQLLQEFIEPLLDGTEKEAEYLDKAGIGMVAWNYHVARAHDSPFLDEIEEVFLHVRQNMVANPATMDALLERKGAHFGQYAQFLVQIDSRPSEHGGRMLRVSSLPIERLPEYAEAMRGGRTDRTKGRFGFMKYADPPAHKP